MAADLVVAMAQGGRGALSRLIDLYGRGLTSYCARALDNAADAEDAVQEVFLKAWSAAARYDPARAQVNTWLYHIALRHCIDMNRRGRLRRLLGLGDDPAADLADEAPDALRAVGGREELEKVRGAIAALPDRQRQALLLKIVAELDNSAIADTMQCGVGAVEQLLVRARAHLRSTVALELSFD